MPDTFEADRSIRLGDTVEVISWGKPIMGTVTQIGHFTKLASQIRRHDTGQLRAILPPGNCARR